MKINIKIIRACLIVLTLFAATAAAQDLTGKMPPMIRVSGDAVVTAKPDRAQIDIGVVTQAVSSQVAVEQNSGQLETTLSELRKLLGANADIKTIAYSLAPTYHYQPGVEPTFTGYTASNTVRVTLNDLTQIGKVISTAGATGANRIQSLQFTLRNQQTVQAQALSEAAVNARKKAERLASALGVKILRVLSVADSSPVFFPGQNVYYSAVNAGASSSMTPVMPGTIEVRAVVTLTVEISPQ